MTSPSGEEDGQHVGDKEMPRVDLGRKYHIDTTNDKRGVYIQYLTEGRVLGDEKLLPKVKRGVWRFCILRDSKGNIQLYHKAKEF